MSPRFTSRVLDVTVLVLALAPIWNWSDSLAGWMSNEAEVAVLEMFEAVMLKLTLAFDDPVRSTNWNRALVPDPDAVIVTVWTEDPMVAVATSSVDPLTTVYCTETVTSWLVLTPEVSEPTVTSMEALPVDTVGVLAWDPYVP